MVKDTRLILGMPVTVVVIDSGATTKILDKIFSYFVYVDEKFSTYKEASEITSINKKELKLEDASEDMKQVFSLCEKTKKETGGYFYIVDRDGKYDPSGLVKGWAINNASGILLKEGFSNFYIDAGGDIQTGGKNGDGKTWTVGIKNPFCDKEIVKSLYIKNEGVATSGTYIRGQHVYNPKNKGEFITDIISLTVIGRNIYEADRFATAAFAMGKEGIGFIEKLDGLEGYMIDKDGLATETSGFERYVKPR